MKRDNELLSEEAQTLVGMHEPMLQHAATKKASLKLGHLGVEAVYPLTPMQRDLYLTSVLKPDTLDVCIGYAISITRPFQIDVLNVVLLACQEQQPMLRTRIYEGSDQRQDQRAHQKNNYSDDVACQCVSTQAIFNLEIIDLTNTDCSDDAIESLIRDFIYAPYDIHSSELVRYRIWRLDNDRTVFAMGCHHILMDGVSLASHLRQVAANYNKALVTGVSSATNSSSAPEANPLEYLDLAEQYCDEFDSQDIREFWSENLQGVEPISLKVAKRTDADEVVNQSVNQSVESNGERGEAPSKLYAVKETHFFDMARVDLIKKYCRQHVITPAMFFRSVYALLLNKYGNPVQPFIIHSAHSFRPKGHELSLGLYVNQIPFVFKPHVLNGAVEDIFSESRRFQKSIRGYEKLSIGETKQLAPSEDVEFVYNFIDFVPEISLNNAAIDVSRYTNHPRNQVQLVVQIESDGLSLNLYHYSEEFESSRFLERMQVVIEQLVNGEKDSQTLCFVLPDEKGKLEKWNNTNTEYPQDVSIHEQFEQQVLVAPNKSALVHGDHTLNYQDLNQASNRLARYLVTQGVAAGDFVGLCLDRSFDMMIGALAVLKTGAAYVPLDPGYPSDRLAYMLDDCRVSIVLTQKVLERSLPVTSNGDYCRSYVCLDDAAFISGLARFSEENLALTRLDDTFSASEPLAYVIYTSGSTGQPKGVCVYHKGVSRLCKNSNYIQITPNDNVTHLSNVSFDAATFELWGALLNGATAIVVDREVLLSDEALAQYFSDNDVSVMFITTALFHYYAIHRVDIFEQFRVVLFGGEACDPNLIAKVYRDAKPNHLVNIYGPTENTVFSLWYELTGCDQERYTIPIGQPISNTTLFVLDNNQQLMPIGVSGELYLGGDGVAKGYLNRAELTNAVFSDHPQFGRLYRTGDWVRVNVEGNVEYLGRIDDQVKIRGFRIEIGEIEKNLLAHQCVSEAVVVAREDQPGHKVLVAYCVASDEDDTQTLDSQKLGTELRQFMKSRLPDYMVPSAFVMLDQMPLTANGKINKKSFPKPQGISGDAEYVEPTTYQEKILALIWSEVLGGQKIGVNDNFFELGGDSIISIQIISRAKRVGLHLQPQHLFEHPTIAELASIASSERISIIAEQGAVNGEVPMQPIQKWFMEEHKEDRQHFNHGLILSIKESFSESDVEQVIAVLVEKHDGLRGQFCNDHQQKDEECWVQRICTVDQLGFELKHLTISASDWDKKDTLLADFANELHVSFEFDNCGLVSIGFIETPSGQDNRLLLVVHHLLIDVVSWRILMDDINVGLANIAVGKDIDLGLKTTSIQQWGNALLEYSKTDVVLDKLEYWRSLSNVGFTVLPKDNHCTENTYGQMKEHVASLDVDQTKQLLSQVNGAYRTDIEDVLLSALAMTISQWASGVKKGGSLLDSTNLDVQNKVYLQLESHGRENISTAVDVTGTLGWFTSVFPVLLELGGVDLANSNSYGAVIQSVKEQLRQVGEGEGGFSFGLLRYLADEEISQQLTSVPTPEIVFNYLGQLDNIVNQGHGSYPTNETVGDMCGERLNRQHLLDINCRVEDGVFKAFWSYNADMHDEATISRVAGQYIDCLSALIKHCLVKENKGITPSDVPLIQVDQAGLDHMVKTVLQQNDGFAVGNIQSIYPLSPMQEGMLFHSVYQPESAFYIDQMELQVDGGIDLEILTKAWQRVVARHDILRTAFIYKGVQKPIQVVFDNVNVDIDVYDWSQDDGDMTFPKWLVADKAKGFEFSDPGLFRFSWFILPNQEQRLVWTFQHILLDGWSLPLVLGEVMQTYSDLLNGNSLPSGTVPQYQNFIRWLSVQPKLEAEAYWREYLAGFSAPNAFPQMKTIPLQESTHATWKESLVVLDEDTLQNLNKIAHDHHLTLNTIVQGAWALLLSRYSREHDVVFGTTVSGRPAELRDVEQTVGIFINTLPLRAKIDADQPFSAWLKGLQQQQVEMRRYEHVPLVDVQSVSEVSSKQALFDSIVVFENYPMDQSFFDYLPIKLTEVTLVEHANYPLTLIVIPGDKLTFKMSYNDSLFDEADVKRMLGHLIVMLQGVASQPDTLLQDLPWLTKDEVLQVTTEWNETEIAYPSECSLVDLFEQKVQSYPEYTAVSFGEERLTYQQLNVFSNQVAHGLISSGVVPGDKVAVVMGRSLSMIISTIAVLKVGGVYVPIDPSYPEDRIVYMLSDTAASVLITCGIDEPKIRSLNLNLNTDAQPTLLVWETLSANLSNAVQQEHSNNPNVPASSSDLAYVIYTSGSTGTPKGVCVSQKAVSRLVINTNFVEILPGDTVAHLSNVSFDAATFDIWGALLNGGEVVGFDNDTLLDPEKFYLVLGKKNIKAMFLTVALFNLLTKQKVDIFANVDTLLFGGENADPKQVRQVLYDKEGKACPKHLVNVYGPTENTTFSTYFPLTTLDESALNVPIGKPVANSTTYILDEMRRPVPIGVPGELYVGGLGVANGYLNQAELTNSFFMSNPYESSSFSALVSTNLYRTGDVCRYLGDGNIEILGRIDDQVKIRGFRIELGEVENHLNVIPGVSNACVLVKKNQQSDKHMVAYVLLEVDADLSVHSLKSEMKKRVPDYLVPAAFVFITDLPLNANGKVDKKKLPEPDEFCYDSNEYVMPKNAIEQQLVDIWQDVLGLTRVSVTDDFFDLGGHSLLVTQVVSRIREEMEIDISLRTLFEATTIATVAEIIAVVMPSPEVSLNGEQTGSEIEGCEDDDDEFEEFTL
ncbi:hypothetical protein A9Q81_23000 [Gammaproteobacteria bacterium 42_54_T18]|nr:hypothetical protein A9Q81_23000 [Gammaproteobacteria bacterium 42_54_T18]